MIIFYVVRSIVSYFWHNKLMTALLALSLFTSYKLIIINYEISSPLISKRAETYTDVWNGRALCLTELEAIHNEQKAQRDLQGME